MTEHRPIKTSPAPAKLTVAAFLLLNKARVFGADSRTELIDGQVYIVSPQYRRHARAKTTMVIALNDSLREHRSNLSVMIEASIRIDPVNMPMPDIAIVTDDGGDGYQPVADAHLFVEISDFSLRLDSSTKARIYGAAGVPEYWIIDLKGREIRILTQPGTRGYAVETRVAFGQPLASVTIDGLVIATDALA